MSEGRLLRAIEIFSTRLQVLARLLATAEAQWRDKGRDPEELTAARLAPDMFPLTHQIVFACNQPNALLAWCTGTTAAKTDAARLDFAGMKDHLAATIRSIGEKAEGLDDGVLDRDKHIELLAGASVDLPGRLYIEDWLVPNFYFHLVTAYDILRHEGVQIGKADYMAHLADRVKGAE